ncbi:MAG: recombination protein RecR [Bacteroidales bacterium]|nr:recombination protein RecR [Bacteroidales bacterium]
MDYLNSKYLSKVVSELSKLPGIGRKTALRLALHLLRQPATEVEALGESLLLMRTNIRFCKHCHNISDSEVCEICTNHTRSNGQICVVSDINDVMAIERTGEFNGRFHVLGGVISPMDGIGPNDLNIESVMPRISNEQISEVILALPTTVEGDTTNFFLYKKLLPFNLKITTIARGVSIGDDLEYIDEVTLGRSLINRLPFDDTLKRASVK